MEKNQCQKKSGKIEKNQEQGKPNPQGSLEIKEKKQEIERKRSNSFSNKKFENIIYFSKANLDFFAGVSASLFDGFFAVKNNFALATTSKAIATNTRITSSCKSLELWAEDAGDWEEIWLAGTES